MYKATHVITKSNKRKQEQDSYNKIYSQLVVMFLTSVIHPF